MGEDGGFLSPKSLVNNWQERSEVYLGMRLNSRWANHKGAHERGEPLAKRAQTLLVQGRGSGLCGAGVPKTCQIRPNAAQAVEREAQVLGTLGRNDFKTGPGSGGQGGSQPGPRQVGCPAAAAAAGRQELVIHVWLRLQQSSWAGCCRAGGRGREQRSLLTQEPAGSGPLIH